MFRSMSPTVLLLLIGGAWFVLGAVIAYLMARRGHDPFGWWLLGSVLGPLVLVLAAGAVLHNRRVRTRLIRPGSPSGGPVDVAVGIDGSPQSEAALDHAVNLFGPRIGRLTLAAVLDYETMDRAGSEEERRATNQLDRLATSAWGWKAETILLTGRPSQQLTRFAEDEGFDVLAIGTRGRGASKALLGSVAARVVHGCAVPVLLATRSSPIARDRSSGSKHRKVRIS